MQLRSVNKAYAYLKSKDPETAITLYLFRELVKQGKIPCIDNGNRRYVDIETLEDDFKKAILNAAAKRNAI